MKKHPTPQMGTHGDVILQRFGAFFLDTILVTVIFAVLGGIGLLLGETIAMVLLLIASLIAVAYKFVLEGVYGYTIGKYVLGLVVVKTDGTNIGMVDSLIRNLLLIVDNLPTAYLIGIALIFMTDENQRVGDIVADTVVVSSR